MKRLPLVVANWKMNHTASQARDFAVRLLALLSSGPHAADPRADAADRRVEVAIAPAFPALESLGRALAGSEVTLAAQDVHEAASGAFTGEVSAAMLEDLGCRYVLIGHSERRQHFGESDERIAAKLARVAQTSLCPILCVGESAQERAAGELGDVLERQLRAPLRQLSARIDEAGRAPALVVAYEPVWAIGTGRVATPEIAQAAHFEIRRRLVAGLGGAGESIRILYGGSLKPANAPGLLALPDVDGALVGGASLDPGDFACIVSACRETRLEPS
jgi:triosephosphate isomerase (TIM)